MGCKYRKVLHPSASRPKSIVPWCLKPETSRTLAPKGRKVLQPSTSGPNPLAPQIPKVSYPAVTRVQNNSESRGRHSVQIERPGIRFGHAWAQGCPQMSNGSFRSESTLLFALRPEATTLFVLLHVKAAFAKLHG